MQDVACAQRFRFNWCSISALPSLSRQTAIRQAGPWIMSPQNGTPFAVSSSTSRPRSSTSGPGAGGACAAAHAFAADRFRNAFVTSDDGVHVHYLQDGTPGQQPAVLFIPGWTWTADVWIEQMRRVDGRAVFAMDPCSQGESPKTHERNSPEGCAGDIEALLHRASDAPVVLVGWSQGVQDIAAYVERYGTARIAGLVWIDSALAIGTKSVAQDPAGVAQLLQRIAILAQYPREYIGGMHDASRPQPVAAAERSRYIALSRKTPADISLAMQVTDLLTVDRTPVLAKIDKPLLILASAAPDELEAQRAIAARVPGARIVVVDNAGHAVFLGQPDVFSGELGKFPADLDCRKANQSFVAVFLPNCSSRKARIIANARAAARAS